MGLDNESANSSLVVPDTQNVIDELCDLTRTEEHASTSTSTMKNYTTLPALKKCIVRLEKQDLVLQSQNKPTIHEHKLPAFEKFSSLQVLKRVPKAARISLSQAMTKVLLNVVTQNDQASWHDLLVLAPNCLQKPRKAAKNGPSLATLVKRNVMAFEKNGPKELVSTEFKQKDTKRGKNNIPLEFTGSKQVSAKLSSGDVRGAIRILASDDTLLPFNSMTSSKLAEKHPSTPNDLKLPAEPSPADKDTCFTVSREEVKKCLNRFNPGSGGGHDCLLPQHLKDLSSESLGKVANDLLDALCRFFNEIVLPGNVPANVCPAFYGAKMFVLSKKGGGISKGG